MRPYYLIISYLALMSCTTEREVELPAYEPKLVIDGAIEAVVEDGRVVGSVAKVAITNSVSFFESISGADLARASDLSALVFISNGNLEEQLVLRLFGNDEGSFPLDIYESRRIKGQIGGKYSIRIRFGDPSAQFFGSEYIAETTIPSPVTLDSVWMEREEENDFRLRARLIDNPNQENFYRVFTRRKNKDNKFIPMHYSTLGDQFFNGDTLDLTILRGLESFSDVNKDLFFTEGDTIEVKFCAIDRLHFDFWRTLDRELYAAGNPFSSSGNTIESNIQTISGEEALGVFGGYGATLYEVVAQ